LKKFFLLQNDLFKLPIELETLLPQYCQSLPPQRMMLIYDRVQTLKKQVDEMNPLNDNVSALFKKEKLVSELSNSITSGQGIISDMRAWIATAFPKTDTNPASKQPRVLMAYLMEWYINLVSTLEMVMEEEF